MRLTTVIDPLYREALALARSDGDFEGRGLKLVEASPGYAPGKYGPRVLDDRPGRQVPVWIDDPRAF